MKKYYIEDLNEKQAIHAPTKEIAEKLCQKFDELGLKWYWGDSYLKRHKWEECKEETCYRPLTGNFSSKKWYEENNFEILTIDQLYDFDEPLKIEVGKFYRAREGQKVRIYAVESNGNLPIHGAVKVGSRPWQACSWTINGMRNDNGDYSCSDIIEEWGDELEFDVESLPKWRYIAMDSDGAWLVYSEKPEKSSTYWYTKNDSVGQYIEEKDCPKNYKGSWEDSLYELRDGKFIKVKL